MPIGKLFKLPAALLLLTMTPALTAAEALRVFAMTYPAWVVRDYQTLPLSPGFRLEPSDLLRTGTGGRLLLQMPDGGALKLGESARLLIESIDDDASAGRFSGRFQLLRGAARHTPSVWPGASASARIELRVGDFLAVVDGADIWGRSGVGDDQVALLDGEIEIATADKTPRAIDVPGVYGSAQTSDTSPPGSKLDPAAVREWLALTELVDSSGIAAHDGEWHLVLVSLTSLVQAEKALQGYRGLGFPAWRKSVIRDGRTLHRLLVPGFVSIDAALAARDRVAAVLGVTDAWVWKAPR